MERVIKFLVKSQSEAYSVIEQLRTLNSEGEISLAETYVLEKDTNGKVTLKDDRGMTFKYTAVGALSGGLIGLLAGPVGFALGTAYGAMLGTTGDLINHGSQEDILDEFGRKMPNGASMVISHVYEKWKIPIDSAIGSLAKIERIDVEEMDNAIQTNLNHIDKSIEDAKQNLIAASKDRKERIQKKIDKLNEQRRVKKEQQKTNALTRKKAYKKWFETFKKKIKKK